MEQEIIHTEESAQEPKIIPFAPNESDNQKTKSRYNLFFRILAGFLAVLMIAQISLFNASSVTFFREKFAGTEYEAAADYIAQNDEYLNATRLQRMREYVRSIGIPNTYEDYSVCASVAIADENYADAITYLSMAVDLFDGPADERGSLMVKLGCLYGMNGNWVRAKRELASAVKLNPSDTSGWLMLAESALRTGDYELALDAMQTYGEMVPLDVSQLSAVAAMQMSLGRGADAVETCTTALGMEGCNEAEFLYSRAQGYLLMGDMEKAGEDIQALRELNSDEVDVRVLEAIDMDARGDYSGALEKYTAILQNQPENLTIYEQAIQCAYLSEDYTSMVSLGTKALKLPMDEAASANLKKWVGVAQLELGEYETAHSLLSQYLQVDEGAGEIHYLRALCSMALMDFDSAVEDFTLAAQTEGLTDECLYNRALCYIETGKAEEAAADFEEILLRNQNPEVVELTMQLLGIEPDSE